MIKRIEESKDDMVKNAGYDEIVIEDFYDVFIEQVKKLSKLPKDFSD